MPKKDIDPNVNLDPNEDIQVDTECPSEDADGDETSTPSVPPKLRIDDDAAQGMWSYGYSAYIDHNTDILLGNKDYLYYLDKSNEVAIIKKEKNSKQVAKISPQKKKAGKAIFIQQCIFMKIHLF